MNYSDKEKENPAGECDIVSVGSWLRRVREEKGETLDEISKITRIGKNYLAAIEAGDASKLPNQAYTRGFIRLYAAHLGLSPEEALSMVKQNLAEAVESKHAPLPTHKETKFQPPYRLIIILLTVLILTLAAGYVLFKPAKNPKTPEQTGRIDTTQQSPAEIIPKSAQQPSLPSVPLSSPLPQQQNGDNSHNEGIVLRLKAVSDGKVHIIIDGSVSQEYALVAGDLVEWKAASAFTLDLENAASVEGELDGKPLQPFGNPGKAAHLLIRKDGIHME